MLHENPLMADIDVNHWRNLHDLMLESGKEKRRIILIHENGELLKFVHSERLEIIRNVERVDNPQETAEKVYRANAGKADFVMVLERTAVERYFAQVQDTWKSGEDLDEYVHRMFATMDEYPEGIVTFPGPARTNLGLQWRVGASYEDIKSAAAKYVPTNSTVLFGVFSEQDLWASLVLSFDGDGRIDVITTADPSELSPSGDWRTDARAVIDWANGKYRPCSLGLFMDVESAKALLANQDKLSTLKKIATDGRLLAEPLPASLTSAL